MKELIQQLAILREYAEKAIFQEGTLDPMEEADRASRVRQLILLGKGFQLTPKEIVIMIMAGASPAADYCGCHSCRSRSSNEA